MNPAQRLNEALDECDRVTAECARVTVQRDELRLRVALLEDLARDARAWMKLREPGLRGRALAKRIDAALAKPKKET